MQVVYNLCTACDQGLCTGLDTWFISKLYPIRACSVAKLGNYLGTQVDKAVYQLGTILLQAVYGVLVALFVGKAAATTSASSGLEQLVS